ncbi:SIMPL domain-containing protein [Anaerotignum sp.]|uniref:SIMPL domain-containing protein n=1 Tax=Anaerotignum sp. TaxID=2039241 RepID=UPI002899E363|nr:SIMPL domain-containing protein [Anaerotignum sp.]
MKKFKTLLITTSLAAVLIFGSASSAFAAEGAGITTNGTGIVSVLPDTATVSLSVQTTGKTADAAQKENNKISTKVVDKLMELGVAKDKIITNYSSVYPQYQYDDVTGKSTITSYRANASFDVTVKDIDHVGTYIDGALKAGATGFNGVSFSLEDPNPYYVQALQAAVKNASIAANAIAAAYGKPLGEIQKVEEQASYSSFEETAVYNEKAVLDSVRGSSGNSTEIQYNKIKVTATITATYGL